MEWQITYFNNRLQTDIMSWTPGLVAHYLRLTRLMRQHGPDLGMPHTRALGKGLFEIRLKGVAGIGRVFYCTKVGKQIVILHYFTKKTQKTPKKELDIAYSRLKEVQHA